VLDQAADRLADRYKPVVRCFCVGFRLKMKLPIGSKVYTICRSKCLIGEVGLTVTTGSRG